jgi:Protein of unknown function (DUF3833)
LAISPLCLITGIVMKRGPVVLGVALALAGCVRPVAPESFAQNRPLFRPEHFFGTTATGHGVIQSASGKPARQLRVESRGSMLPDGRFRLDQDIYEAGKTSHRHWIMTRIDDRRYVATLSDAAGPVTAEVYGNLFHLRYRFKKPFVTMEQWLYLQPDGRTVLNTGTIRMPGRTIARLSEVIVRD